MSQISLSHQFSKRWLAAPKPVREALVQELDDIVQLLDSETDLGSFKFTTPDLYQYIEDVYQDFATENAKKAALEASQKAADESLQNNLRDGDEANVQEDPDDNSVDPVDKPVYTLANSTENETIIDQVITDSPDEHVDNEPSSNAKQTDSNSTDNQEGKIGSTVTVHDIGQDKHDADNLDKPAVQEATSTTTAQQVPKNTSEPLYKTNDLTQNMAIQEDFLKQLEMHIDDYLTERLTDISEDLKSWLRDEVKQHNQKASKK